LLVLAPFVWRNTTGVIGNDVNLPPLQRLSAGSIRGTPFFKYHAAHRMPVSELATIVAKRLTADGAASGSSRGIRTILEA